MAGGFGARSAVGDLTAAGGTALDGQERLGNIGPASIPFDAAALDRVLSLEHQRVFGFKAVVNRRCPRVEVAHQVEHSVADAGGIDTDVLDVETLGELLDLFGLVFERLAAPTVLFQNPELAPVFQRRGDDHAAGIVAGAAGVVTDPHGTVAEGARVAYMLTALFTLLQILLLVPKYRQMLRDWKGK